MLARSTVKSGPKVYNIRFLMRRPIKMSVETDVDSQ